MKSEIRGYAPVTLLALSKLVLSLLIVMGISTTGRADEADARKLLKAMSDYVAAQKVVSFEYDASLEVVTKDEQKLALVSSGSVSLNRPNQIRTTRAGGFVDVETFFDGKTLTVVGKNLNVYAQAKAPGTVDQLVDALQDKFNRPLPAADLLLSNAFDALMPGVTDIKDLGSGVIGGVECDFLAFRTDAVDWQIWIAQGDEPRPCRYTITSKLVSGGPQYSIQFRDWKTGDDVAIIDYSFNNSTKAKKIELDDLEDSGGLPQHFIMGDAR